jgi:hypothetical protein
MRMRTTIPLPRSLVLVAAAVACGDAVPDRPTVRDSTGVAIVETPAVVLATVPAWRVADPPLLEIGAVEGDPAQQFAGIEGVLRLRDGRLVVADRGSGELRFFDDRGRHLASHGGPGDAPGEYRYLTGLGAGPGDSLWAFDFGLRRFTVFDAEGGTARTLAVGSRLAAVTAVGRLRDGSFVIREQWSAALQAEPRAGLVRDPAAVARLAPDGAALDTITLVPGREVFVASEDGRAVMRAPLLARHAVAATGDSLVFVGDQATFEVRAYDAAGALRRVIRLTGLDLAVTTEDERRALEARVGDATPGERPAVRAGYADMTTPATRPAYGPLLVDDAGALWVGSFERSGPSRTWTVFGRDGMLQATVTLPAGFQLRQVTGDLAIGTWRDALDVEYVRVYGIDR